MRGLRGVGSSHGALGLALLISLLLAGCAKPDEPLTQESVPTGILSGVVTDVALSPLAGVNVTVADGNQSALTDAAGAFRFVLEPGEHLLVARLDGYENAAVRASVVPAQAIGVNVTLTPVPRETPRIESQEGKGLIGCALFVPGQPETACPSQDANAKPTVDFVVGDTNGLEGIVLELDWTPGSKTSETLALRVDLLDGETVHALAATEGTAPLSVTLPARVLDGKIASGHTLRLAAAPAGSLTDDEAGLDAGAALQQAFTAYASFFYHEAPPAGFSVIER